MLLLTGPNMAGKSTYLRQVAQIVLLAQIGSFVPAQAATVGLADRIFARVGADDDLAHGVSTFMREMSETAFILRHATQRSLVILDEVGRGTSTRDGQALAQAVLEHVHDRIGARTLFATHFHDLAELLRRLPRLEVASMDVEERDDSVVFLHRLRMGSVGRSLGIHVARMAGVPDAVTHRAAVLATVRPGTTLADGAPSRYRGTSAVVTSDTVVTSLNHRLVSSDSQDGTIPATARDVVLALAGCNVAAITPIEAINLLFSLQQRAAACLPELDV
jgi:DNA mismatch repair protein MutS